MKLRTHVNFPGNCEQAFAHYQELMGCRDPHDDEAEAGHLGTIFIEDYLRVERHQPMRSAYLYLVADSVEEAERIDDALKEGGQVFMPLQETFYAPRFSQLRDQFCTNWTLIQEAAR